MSRAASRHLSRRAALQVLYASDLGGASGGAALSIDEVFTRVAASFDLPESARGFARELVRGVDAERPALDERIAAHTRNWRVARMAAVDRNVLRLAAWELLHTDTPAEVVIDEAVELARDFGTERSAAFVNGVIDALARDRSERGEAVGQVAGVEGEP